MKLKLKNTKSGQVEEFNPIDPKNVRMYVCGPTIYAEPHVGNARPAVAFDVLFRVLRELYGEDHVTYVSNFTDIDDKIIAKSLKAGVPMEEVTNLAAQQYYEMKATLGILDPTIRPYASKYVDQMIAMIQVLIDKGHAYIATDGDVLFHVPSNPNSGFQDNRKEGGAYGEDYENNKASTKRDVRDFTLWKLRKPNEPFWESPWGDGRPGWHIECSAMIAATMGDTIDIHGGGTDLMFPHHDAELAQSGCAHGVPLANYWLHSGMLTYNGNKMAKSLGNTQYVSKLSEFVPGEVIRFFLLKTHFSETIDVANLMSFNESHKLLDSWYRLLWDFRHLKVDPNVDHDYRFMDRILANLDIAGAIRHIHGLHNDVRRFQGNPETASIYLSKFVKAGKLLGLFQYEPDFWFHYHVNRTEVERLISEQDSARAAKDWATSDAIREKLRGMGVIVENGLGGTFWQTVLGVVRKG